MAYQHTVEPLVVGASVIACKFDQGVLMCTDTLASYGRLARYKMVPRMAAVGKETLVGASGQYSDFQEVIRLLRAKHTEDFIQHDGICLNASHFSSYAASVMYQRRNKMDPLFNSVLVAGFANDQPYLSLVDLYGAQILGDYLVTGFANHLGKPVFESEWREGLSLQEAKILMEKVMRILWYRDSMASDRIQFAVVTREGIAFEEPYTIESEWEFGTFKEYMLNPLFPTKQLSFQMIRCCGLNQRWKNLYGDKIKDFLVVQGDEMDKQNISILQKLNTVLF